jgi:hypothetical protein
MRDVADPSLNEVGKRATIGTTAGSQVSHQLTIERSRLPASRMKPAFRRDVGARDDELPLEGDDLDKIQEEAFACAKPPNDEAHSRGATCNALQILEDRPNLGLAANLDMLQTNSRHDARAK